MPQLQDCVCLVTNGDWYMGPAVAAEFLREGATVVLQAVDPDRARGLLAENGADPNAEEASGRLRLIGADLGERGAPDALVDRVVADHRCGEVIKFSGGIG